MDTIIKVVFVIFEEGDKNQQKCVKWLYLFVWFAKRVIGYFPKFSKNRWVQAGILLKQVDVYDIFNPNPPFYPHEKLLKKKNQVHTHHQVVWQLVWEL